MRWISFFVLWRCGVICLLAYAASQLYGWQPTPLLMVAMVAIAADSIVTLMTLRRPKDGSRRGPI